MTRRGWVLFAAMSVLWGIPYLLIKVAVDELAPPTLVFLRCAIGALVLLPYAAARGHLRPLRGAVGPLVAFTLLELTIPWLLLADAERRLSSSVTGLLVAAVPLVAAVASRLVGEQDRLDRTRLAGLLVGLSGVAVLLGLEVRGDAWAAVEVGLVVLGYGTAPLLASRRLSHVSGLGVTAAALTLTSLVYLPFAAVNLPAQVPSGKVVLSVAVLALACTVVAFLVFFALIKEVGPNRALVITFVNPAVAVALGVLLLDEPFTLGTAVGFPLILGGCLLATRRSTSTAPAVAEP
jgi:drug/metabolite transporter (DMT)-like permease